jgi:hypothetical protein
MPGSMEGPGAGPAGGGHALSRQAAMEMVISPT